MQPRKIICQGDNHKNNRENFNVENLPQSEKRKNHGTFVGVHPNIHYNNLGTKPNSMFLGPPFLNQHQPQYPDNRTRL